MNIAVVFGEIGFISRYIIIDGIRAAAKKHNANVMLFTCEGFLFEHLEDYIHGEYNIFNLPSFDNYDGVIVDYTSIQDEDVVSELEKRIVASKVPCVSFNMPSEGADVITFDNKAGFEELLLHLIEDHGLKSFSYMSGPWGNRDSKQRLEIFKNVTASHGIEVPKDRIHFGDFNFGSGRELVREYMVKKKELPEVFVAANDFMAIGIISQLKKYGIDVPGKVRVTGYDNSEVAQLTSPRLTTVDRKEYEAGVIAFEKLFEKIEGRKEVQSIVIESKMTAGSTCGCENPDSYTYNDEECIEMKINMDMSLDVLKGLSIEFLNTTKLSDFERAMEQYIEKFGMEFFYFCQCGSRESYYRELDQIASGIPVDRDITTYDETAWCPIAYENGEWKSYTSFDTRMLFPPGSNYKKDNSYYIVMPVHDGKRCIGYSIIGNFRDDLSGRAIQHLILKIDSAIATIYNQDLKNTMLAKINQKWQYDDLTGIYNRSGMRVMSEALIELARERNSGISVTFFDLDGLKRINDIEGHKAGDSYIKSMAEMLQGAGEEDDIVVRYGGDEFLVISPAANISRAREKMNRLSEAIKEPVKASAGFEFGYPQIMKELEKLIASADKKMYEEKKRKKAAR